LSSEESTNSSYLVSNCAFLTFKLSRISSISFLASSLTLSFFDSSSSI
jgi:hypothetical protein